MAIVRISCLSKRQGRRTWLPEQELWNCVIKTPQTLQLEAYVNEINKLCITLKKSERERKNGSIC